MGRRQKLKSGDEWATVSRKARRIVKTFIRAGVAKGIKKKMNKRLRREIKLMLKGNGA